MTSVKEKQLPDLDDELAQDISERFETLDDLKNDLRERLRSNADAHIRNGLIEQIMDRVVESSEVPLPKSMVAADMQRAWSGFAARTGQTADQLAAAIEADGGSVEQKRSKSCVRRWSAGCAIRWSRRRWPTEEKIEVSDEDVDARLATSWPGRAAKTSKELRARYERQNMLDYLRRELREQRSCTTA